MQFIKRILSYFCPVYLNDWRHSNQIVSTLKLFFDRNNKAFHLISTLGNVFRGSKWSDLRISNAKTSLTTRYRKFLLLTFFLFFLLFLVGILPNSNLANSFWDLYYYLGACIRDWFICIGFSSHAIKRYVVSRLITSEIRFMSPSTLNSQSESSTVRKFNFSKLGSICALNESWSSFIAEVNFKITSTIGLFAHSSKFSNFESTFNKPTPPFTSGNFYYNNALAALLSSRSSMHGSVIKPASILRLEPIAGYTPSVILGKDLSDLNYFILNSRGINFSAGSDQHYHSLMIQAANSLGDAKAVRWLTKNTPLDSGLDRSNNAYVAAKSLSNFSSTDLDKSDSNLWQSTFFSNNNVDISAKSPTSIGKYSQDFLRNYNLFEEGRESFSRRSLLLAPQYNTRRKYSYCMDLPEELLLLLDEDTARLYRSLTAFHNSQVVNYPNFSFRGDSSSPLDSHTAKTDASDSSRYSGTSSDSGIGSSQNLHTIYCMGSTPARVAGNRKNWY